MLIFLRICPQTVRIATFPFVLAGRFLPFSNMHRGIMSESARAGPLKPTRRCLLLPRAWLLRQNDRYGTSENGMP